MYGLMCWNNKKAIRCDLGNLNDKDYECVSAIACRTSWTCLGTYLYINTVCTSTYACIGIILAE